MKNITKENFEKEVLNSSMPFVLDFWATWCGPCRMMAPILEELEQELGGKVVFGKNNVDDDPVLAIQYHVESIPFIALFENGSIKTYSIGYQTKDELRKSLNI